MSVIGPHIGAIIGALIYQLCVGLHWSEEDSDQEDEAEINTPSLLAVKELEGKKKTFYVPDFRHKTQI